MLIMGISALMLPCSSFLRDANPDALKAYAEYWTYGYLRTALLVYDGMLCSQWFPSVSIAAKTKPYFSPHSWSIFWKPKISAGFLVHVVYAGRSGVRLGSLLRSIILTGLTPSKDLQLPPGCLEAEEVCVTPFGVSGFPRCIGVNSPSASEAPLQPPCLQLVV